MCGRSIAEVENQCKISPLWLHWLSICIQAIKWHLKLSSALESYWPYSILTSQLILEIIYLFYTAPGYRDFLLYSPISRNVEFYIIITIIYLTSISFLMIFVNGKNYYFVFRLFRYVIWKCTCTSYSFFLIRIMLFPI